MLPTAAQPLRRCPLPYSPPALPCLHPPPPLPAPQGLAFVWRKKRGAMVSLTKETVVLIGKLTAPDGGVAWSGPIFLSGRSWGAGCTLGERQWVGLVWTGCCC